MLKLMYIDMWLTSLTLITLTRSSWFNQTDVDDLVNIATITVGIPVSMCAFSAQEAV
jgi:hypothetical protein